MKKSSIAISTPLLDVPGPALANLSRPQIQKLAIAVASFAGKTDPADITVEDLLNYFPARYEDRSKFVGIDELTDGMEAAVEIYVKTSGGFRVGRNRNPRQPPLYIFEISGSDEARRQRPVLVKWFVSGKQGDRIVSYYNDRFLRGTRFVAFGKWEWDKRLGTYSLMLNKPEELEVLPPVTGTTSRADLFDRSEASNRNDDDALIEDEGDPAFAPIHNARRVPVYRKLGPFQTKRLREIMHTVLAHLDRSSVADDLPAGLLKRQDLISRAQAISEIHFPPDDSSIADYEMFRSAAHKRLIFDEFFGCRSRCSCCGASVLKEPKGTVIEITEATRQRLREFLPFQLTGAQKKVIGEIFGDLRSDSPMNRLVQGDVGSGKTIVAFLAMFAAMENGYQAAMMAPTEILAEQHYRNAVRLFENTGYRVALLIGSTKAAEKRKVYEALAAGDINILIGTHAVIQEGVKFDRLGLAVIDEQHRFGVMQRAQLRALGLNPDILVMTATPIPRSLAMTVYGDLDVSIIDEMPPGRTPINTVVVGEDKRQGVYRGIDREVKLGRQVYVVYPLIEESAKMDLKAATIMYEDLRTRAFPQYTVGLLHGKMKAAGARKP
jgi:ATP-dependent DNA helicase RecG